MTGSGHETAAAALIWASNYGIRPVSSTEGVPGALRVSSWSSVSGVDYRYELRRGDEVVATGHLNYERPLAVGDRVELGGQFGIVRTIEPLLGEREVRLVVQLLLERG
jgi:hypothetical protein